jgi:hypothetical protein
MACMACMLGLYVGHCVHGSLSVTDVVCIRLPLPAEAAYLPPTPTSARAAVWTRAC